MEFNKKDFMTSTRGLFFVTLTCAALLAALALNAQEDSKSHLNLDVVHGPTNATLGSIAQIALPEGYVFLDGKNTREMLKASGEPVRGDELGYLRATNQDWSVYFMFRDIGFVKDDDKDKLDADKLLESIKKGTAAANKERQSAGNPPLEIVGWEIPPKYDPASHNLEWAIRGTCQGETILNYNTRLLGRKGVMSVVLVVGPEDLSKTLPAFRKLLAGYEYQNGQTYAEYKQGDKIAKYGLGALVVGGAAVGAAKLGLFAWLAVFFKKAGKLVIVALVAIAAGIKKFFSRGTKQPN